ncbi:MAG: HlyC/CorC family transporter [Rhizobiaceae bacterium]|nr:HlyC/CorC family transporter [Rhizobiaceae bacterium]
MLVIEIGAVVVLILINGLLAMSELAVVSSRPARLKTMIDRGVKGASRALALAANPGRFLSTVQIGITLVGVLSGAFSGATLGQRLAHVLVEAGVPDGVADALGVGIVVAIITYASLIVGELVPKQIALRNPEGIAVRVSPAMTVLSKVAYPLVWLLDFSGRGVLRLLGQKEESEEKVTDEEIKMLVAEAEHHGTIESDERRMIAGVMRLGDRAVRALMTPRTDVDWVNLNADPKAIRKALLDTPHSRLPAGEGSVDSMIGVVQTREVLAALLARKPLDVRKYVKKAPIVHDQADALDVLTTLKNSDVPVALVHDEYGHFEGIVTPADVLEAITGVFRSDYEEDEERQIVRREDGSLLLSGSLPADEMAEHLHIDLPEKRDYETLAGYVLSKMSKLPATGEWVDAQGWRFEVVDLDGRRIDKVLAKKLPGARREKLR